MDFSGRQEARGEMRVVMEADGFVGMIWGDDLVSKWVCLFDREDDAKGWMSNMLVWRGLNGRGSSWRGIVGFSHCFFKFFIYWFRWILNLLTCVFCRPSIHPSLNIQSVFAYVTLAGSHIFRVERVGRVETHLGFGREAGHSGIMGLEGLLGVVLIEGGVKIFEEIVGMELD